MGRAKTTIIEFITNRQSDLYHPASAPREIIGLANSGLKYLATAGLAQVPIYDLTVTVFDTTSRPDAARILLTNSTGSDRWLYNVAVYGTLVIRFGSSDSGGEGFVHDAFIDEESIAKSGVEELKIANRFIIDKAQVEKIADYHWKNNRVVKHIYAMRLSGARYWFEPGEWYTLQVGGVGEREYIDSVVRCEGVTIDRESDGPGTTELLLAEVEQNWVFNTSALARFLAGGTYKREGLGNIVRVAASTFLGKADFYCDGTADEVQIQEAIDWVSPLGGKVVLSEGTFVTAATITMRSNVFLEGAGLNATIIEKNGAYDGVTIGVDEDDFEEYLFVRDLQITRNASDTNSNSLIRIHGLLAGRFENVRLTNSYSAGVHVEGHCQQIQIINCIVDNNKIDGILFNLDPDSDQIIKDMQVAGCQIIDNGDITAAAGFDSDGIDVSEVDSVQIINCQIANNTGVGIGIYDASKCLIQNNHIRNNGHPRTGNGGIEIAQSSTNRVDFNAVLGNLLEENYEYGIKLFASTGANLDNTQIRGNNAVANGAGSILDHEDCEHATDHPHIASDGMALTNLTAARSDVQEKTGSYSRLLTKNIASGTPSNYEFCDNTSTIDLHELIDGETYRASAWVYIPSSGGPAAAEVSIVLHYYDGSWTSEIVYATVQDAWEQIITEITVPSGATGFRFNIHFESTAEDTEYIYIDDVELWHLGVNNIEGNLEVQFKITGSPTNTKETDNSWQ